MGFFFATVKSLVGAVEVVVKIEEKRGVNRQGDVRDDSLLK